MNLKKIQKIKLTANTTVNFDNSMSASDIQDLIDAQPRYIPQGVGLTFQFADGTYNLNNSIEFEGFYGGGFVSIKGNPSENENSLHTNQAVFLDFSNLEIHGILLTACQNAFISVKNLKTKIYSSGSATRIGLYVKSTVGLLVRGNYFLGTSDSLGRGIQSILSIIEVKRNYFSNIQTAIYGTQASHILSDSNDDTGTQPKYGLYATHATTIGKVGTQPSGSIANEVVQNGGEIR